MEENENKVKNLDDSNIKNYNIYNNAVQNDFEKHFGKLPYSKRQLMFSDRNIIIKNEGLLILQDANNIYLSINKKLAEKYSPKDLATYISIATSKIFINQEKILNDSYIPKNTGCAIFMKNVLHYSGGRYCSLLWAHIMASFMKVTIFTNMKPTFLKDFTYMPFTENIEWVTDGRFGLSLTENKFQFVIGVPNDIGQYAITYAEKWKIPSYMLIFESPNYIREYHAGIDSTEEFWASYKKSLYKATKIIAISKISGQKTEEWLKHKDRKTPPIEVIYPNLNQHIADRVLQLDNITEMNEICYISRMTHYKNPLTMLREICKLSNPPDVINLIGRSSSGTLEEIKKLNDKYGKKVQIKVYEGISDIEKFMILRRCKMLVTPSFFEGFSMSPMEAFYMRKPVLAYDIPVLREVYGDTILYSDIKDDDKMAKDIESLLGDTKRREDLGEAGRKRILQWCTYDKTRDFISKVFPVEKNLSISVMVIALNASEFIRTSIKSYYNKVKEIIICEGAVEQYQKSNPTMVQNSHSVDNTLEIIKNYPDSDKKIKLITKDDNKCWKDKSEMQNAILKEIHGDILCKIDSDEVYSEESLERIRHEFEADENLFVLKYCFAHLWKNIKFMTTGSQWDSKMFRCCRWRKDFHYGNSFNYLLDSNNKIVDRPYYKCKSIEERLCFHLSYVTKRPETIQAKLKYYSERGIEKNVDVNLFKNWQQGQPTSPTHGGGIVVPFTGILPKVLNELIAQGY